MPLFRRQPVPEAVRAVALAPGDRRLAWALTEAGEPVVASRAVLRLPGRDPLEWAGVERAVWREPALAVSELARVAGTGRRTELVLREWHDLPEVVRAQVTGSVAWSNHTRLQPHGGVRVVGRRRPGQDLLDWQVVFDQGTDPDDPVVRAQADQLVLDARRTIG